MANVIKHKRGSGSDPGASDLVVGEVAIRTDTGKLFTKMDNGSVAEIAGGGSDIAINTLSSSSGTGGGSATFNGSAYRFTLSQPPSVSAYQLLVSINGVIQKPVSGTGQPSEGFAVDGTDIILGDAPETGADFFILTFKSLGVSEPADNSVTSAKIVDGAIVNADVNASAAIAGTKVSPDFGSQNIVTTGNAGIGATPSTGYQLQVTGQSGYDDVVRITGVGTNIGPRINLTPTGTGVGRLNTTSNSLQLQTVGNTALTIDTSQKVGIGTTSPTNVLTLIGTGNDAGIDLTSTGAHALRFKIDSNQTSANDTIFFQSARWNGTEVASIHMRAGADTTNKDDGSLTFHTATSGSSNAERLRIDSSGRVGINETALSSFNSIADDLIISQASGSAGITIRSGTGNTGVLAFTDGANTNFRGDLRYDHNGDYMRFSTDGDERMRINSSGNIGIGTSSPVKKLHIADAGDVGIALQTTNANTNKEMWEITCGGNASNEADLVFQSRTDAGSGGIEAMRLSSSGRVGIGTSSPEDSLHIKSGKIRIENAIVSNNDSTISYDNADFIIDVDPNNVRGSSLFQVKVDTVAGLTIDDNRRVGIGTTSPAYILDVVDDSGGSFSASTNSTQGQISIVGKNSSGNVSAISRIKSHPDGSSNQSHMAFETRNSSATMVEAMRIDSSGNLTFSMEASSSYPTQKIKWSNDSTTTNGFYIAQHSDRNGRIWHEQGLSLVFGTADTERMRIDHDGKVGINIAGTDNTSPVRNLDIADSSGAILRLISSDDSLGADERVGEIEFFTDDDDAAHISSNIKAIADGSDAYGRRGALTFGTRSDSGNATEKMRIDHSGGLFLGVTSAVNSSSGGICFRNNDAGRKELLMGTTTTSTRALVEFINGNGSVGSITVSGSSTAYNTSSDYRLKENITAISDGITRLKTLKPSRFNFKTDKDTTVDGFLAHEVTAVPEAITGTKDEVATEDSVSHKKGDPIYQSIDQSKLVPLLVAALQEAIGRIEALEAK